MNKESLIQKGFISTPHTVVKEIFVLDVGRYRSIRISAMSTPNEIVFICQEDHNSKKVDMVCVHNFDYDGFLTESKLNTIISIFA